MSLLPEVREELVATAARRVAVPTPPRRSGGAAAVALGVACAVAVVAVAVVSLAHRGPAPAASGPSGTGLAALEARLAVLRRPQTAADRTYARYAKRRGSISPMEVIGKLSRLATTIRTPSAGPIRVYVLVQNLAGFLPGKRASDVATAVAINDQGQLQGGSGRTATALAPNDVGSGRQVPGLGQDPDVGVSVGIVPDGVRRVKWTFTGAGLGVLHPHPVVVYPHVNGNVAVAPVKPGEGPLASVVWYGAGARVIASVGGGARSERRLRAIDAVNASRTRPISPALVSHYALFRTVRPENLRLDAVLPTQGSERDLNYWQTRYIGWVTGLDGRGLWITPGTHDLCMSDWNAGGCGAVKSTGFIGGSTSNGRETTFEGLVPDGNPTVTLVLADGARKTFPVTDNVYEATFRGRVVAVINRDITGRVVRTSLG